MRGKDRFDGTYHPLHTLLRICIAEIEQMPNGIFINRIIIYIKQDMGRL